MSTSTSGAAMPKTIPPIAAPPQQLIFPAYESATLANACKLIMVEDSTQSLVSISVVIKNGALNEPIAGLASLTAKMLKKGTQKRDAQTIAAEIDFLGGNLRVGVDWDSASISLSVLSEYLEDALDLLADVILNPTFNAEELARLQQVSIAGLQQNEVDPNYLVSRAMAHGLFAGHPYGHPARGTQATISAITAEDCRSWYKRAFAADQAFFVAAGDVSKTKIIELLNAKFGQWQTQSEQFETPAAPAQLQGRQILIAPKEDGVQAAVRIAMRAPQQNDPDYVPMQFCNALFGSMFVSRLSSSIREEKGYTYGIDSYLDARRHASALVIGSSFGNDVTTDAVQEVMHELKRIRTEAISADELRLTRNHLLGSFALRFETPQQIVGLVSILELYGLPSDYYQSFYQRIVALKIEELLAVQGRWFDEANLVIAASGDEKHLQAALAQFGTTRTIDINQVSV